MKVELSDKDERQLKRAVENNPVRKYLLNRENVNFEIGDVLIKHIARYDASSPNSQKWVTEPISSENSMPQRYVFIFKDEFGIGYVKRLQVSTGKLGSDIFCFTDYDTSATKFEVDPEYAEQIFLDAEFDIKRLHKESLEARKIISKMNRKNGLKLKTLKDANDFFNGVPVGGKFWMSSDYTAKWTQEMEIIKVQKIAVTSMDVNNDWPWKTFKERHKKDLAYGVNDTYVLKITVADSHSKNRTRDYYCFDFPGRDMIFYKQMPAKEEKKR